jgi:hypothetical protein
MRASLRDLRSSFFVRPGARARAALLGVSAAWMAVEVWMKNPEKEVSTKELKQTGQLAVPQPTVRERRSSRVAR